MSPLWLRLGMAGWVIQWRMIAVRPQNPLPACLRFLFEKLGSVGKVHGHQVQHGIGITGGGLLQLERDLFIGSRRKIFHGTHALRDFENHNQKQV